MGPVRGHKKIWSENTVFIIYFDLIEERPRSN